MCNHLTVLAQDREFRVVAQCEHGALHLAWDIATLRLRPHDFLTLARFLDTCAPRAADALIVDGWCRLACDRNGAARL